MDRGHEAARLDPQWPFIDGDARHNGQPKFSFREQQQQQKLGKPALAEAQVNEAGRQGSKGHYYLNMLEGPRPRTQRFFSKNEGEQ